MIDSSKVSAAHDGFVSQVAPDRGEAPGLAPDHGKPFVIDRSTIATGSIAGMRLLGIVAGYRVLVSGEPMLFVEPPRCATIDEFLLGFSGSGAMCACIGPKGDVLFGCDLYGLTTYFYRVNEHEVVISPMIDAITGTGNEKLDEVSLFELFFTGLVYGSGTPFVDVFKSCPLSVLEITFADAGVRCARRDVLPAITQAPSFDDAIRGAMATVTRDARIQLNFSGGADSTALLRSLQEFGTPFTVSHYMLMPGELSEAYTGLAGTGLRLQVVRPWRQLRCTDLEYRPCAIHTSPEMDLELSDLALATGADMVLTGQNADAMSEFGNTDKVALRDLASSLLMQGLGGTSMRILLARAIEKFPKRVPRRLLRAYSMAASLKNCSSDFELAFLTAMTCRRRPTPMWYNPEELSFLSWELRQAWLERMRGEVRHLDEHPELSFRQKLYVTQFRNYLIGGDVRCITAAAQRAGVRNVQLYTTPPMVSYFFNAEPSVRDILRPKTAIRRYAHWRARPRVAEAHVLSDAERVVVRDASYRLVGELDTRSPEEKLREENARYPWLSRAAFEAVRPLQGPSWRSRVSQLYGLMHGEYAPRSFEDTGALTL